MITVESLNTRYPNTGKSQALTGYIPMEVFEDYEEEIRLAMRAEKARVFYRGPRRSNRCGGYPTNTLRQDATHVVIYRRS